MAVSNFGIQLYLKYQFTISIIWLCLTANDVQSAQRNEWEDVEFLLFDNGLIQFIHQDATLLVKDVDKVIENFEMKRRCQQFTSALPLATRAG
jgi:hypothetical protein